MHLGFSVISRNHQTEFQFFGPHGTDPLSLVTFHQTGNSAAVVMGRIYYRDEKLRDIVGQLPVELADAAKTNDAALALGMYLTRGREGLISLEGEYSLVLWDGRQGILIGSRDPMGAYPLFWAEIDGAIALSTHMRPLVRGSVRGLINPDYLAEFLMPPGTGREELDSERCIFRNVNRVRPGTIVEANMSTRTVQRQVYWDWPSRIATVTARTLEEVGQQYLDLLREAVRQRMVGRVTAHLSGGMDSTAIALLAGRLASEGIGDGPVHGLSLVYEKLSILSRETAYVQAALRVATGIVPHLINGDNILDYDGFLDPPLSDEPCPWLPRLGMNRHLVNVGADLGMHTMMAGIGADEVVDVPPAHISDLLKRGHLLAAWREAGRFSQAMNCNRWKVFSANGLASLLPIWLRYGLRPLLRRGHAGWSNQTGHTIAPWIRPDFARRHRMLDYGLQSLQNISRKYSTMRWSISLFATESRRGDMSRMWLAAPRGLHVTHPFFDPRLVCFGLGIPSHLCCIPGQQKPVLAQATRGLLPDEIRNRQRKGHFNEVTFMGLARNFQALKQLVVTTDADDLGLIDKTVLLDCLHRASLGVATDFRGLDRMDQTLAVLKWLSNLDAWEKAAATPTDVIHLAAAQPSTGPA